MVARRQVLRLCEQAGLAKLGHVALDGTKIKANASKHKARGRERLGAKVRADLGRRRTGWNKHGRGLDHHGVPAALVLRFPIAEVGILGYLYDIEGGRPQSVPRRLRIGSRGHKCNA